MNHDHRTFQFEKNLKMLRRQKGKYTFSLIYGMNSEIISKKIKKFLMINDRSNLKFFKFCVSKIKIFNNLFFPFHYVINSENISKQRNNTLSKRMKSFENFTPKK